MRTPRHAFHCPSLAVVWAPRPRRSMPNSARDCTPVLSGAFRSAFHTPLPTAIFTHASTSLPQLRLCRRSCHGFYRQVKATVNTSDFVAKEIIYRLPRTFCQTFQHECPRVVSMHCLHPRFHGGFHRGVWRGGQSWAGNDREWLKKDSRPWALRHKRTLDHGVQRRFQPVFSVKPWQPPQTMPLAVHR